MGKIGTGKYYSVMRSGCKSQTLLGKHKSQKIIERRHTIPILSLSPRETFKISDTPYGCAAQDEAWSLVMSFIVITALCMSISQQSGLWHQEAWVEAVSCQIAAGVSAWWSYEQRLRVEGTCWMAERKPLSVIPMESWVQWLSSETSYSVKRVETPLSWPNSDRTPNFRGLIARQPEVPG